MYRKDSIIIEEWLKRSDKALYDKMQGAVENGEEITITIK